MQKSKTAAYENPLFLIPLNKKYGSCNKMAELLGCSPRTVNKRVKGMNEHSRLIYNQPRRKAGL